MALDDSSLVDPYDWVDSSVKMVSSSYTRPEHIQYFRKHVPFSRLELSEDDIICLPCSPEDRVHMSLHTENEKDFFYLYETHFLRIKLRIPFSEFECDILKSINLAPSQLQPNSWGFIRAFEILCKFLDIKPSKEKFFYFFFMPKFPSKGIKWGFFQSYSSRKILTPVDISYKNFKENYFKILFRQDVYPFFLDSNGSKKFPLYWSRHPCYPQTNYQSLSWREQKEIDVLCKLPELSCEELIRAEGNSLMLENYYMKMEPSMPTQELRKFLKQHGQLPNGPGGSSKISTSKKKRKVATSASVILTEITENHGEDVQENAVRVANPSSSLVQPACNAEQEKRQDVAFSLDDPNYVVHLLKDFDGPANAIPISLWDKRFKSENLIDLQVALPHDMDMFRPIGARALNRWIELHALRSASVARMAELEAQDMEKRILVLEKEKKAWSIEKETLLQKMESISNEKNNLKEKMKDSEKKYKTLEKEMVTLKENLKNEKEALKAKDSELRMKKTEWDTKETNLKTDLGMRHLSSFDNCINQIQVLYPDLDISRLGAFKEVRNGEIWSPPDSEDEEEVEGDREMISET